MLRPKGVQRKLPAAYIRSRGSATNQTIQLHSIYEKAVTAGSRLKSQQYLSASNQCMGALAADSGPEMVGILEKIASATAKSRAFPSKAKIQTPCKF